MKELETIDDAELQDVTGGWDWARSWRAARGGYTALYHGAIDAGRYLGGTPGAIIGGVAGAVTTALIGWASSATVVAFDAADQRDGRPENNPK